MAENLFMRPACILFLAVLLSASTRLSAQQKPTKADAQTQAVVKREQEALTFVTKFVQIFLPDEPEVDTSKEVLGFEFSTISSATIASEIGEKCKALKMGAEGATVPQALSELAFLLRCAADDGGLFTGKKNTLNLPLEARAAAAEAARLTIRKSADSSTTRAFAKKNQAILAVALIPAKLLRVDKTYVAAEGTRGEFTFEEKARDSRFAADLQNLASVALGVVLRADSTAEVPKGVVESDASFWIDTRLRVQTETRSDVKISYKPKAGIVQLQAAYSDAELAKWRARLALEQAEEDANKLQNATVCADILGKSLGAQDAYAIASCQLLNGTRAVKMAATEALSTRPSPGTTVILRRALAAETAKNPADEELKAAIARAFVSAEKPPSAGPSAGSGDAVTPAARTVTVAAGSKEHWFLSADVMLTDDPKFGLKDKEPSITEKPATFYVGVNYLLGDLLSADRPLWSNIVLKAFVKGTNRPNESVGIALGLRGKYFNWPALNLDVFSPFLAAVWEQRDGSKTFDRAPLGRFGVSVNLDKALDWVK